VFNTIQRPVRKYARCSLDNALFFAASTRAHAGLAKLRSRRSQPQPFAKTSKTTGRRAASALLPASCLFYFRFVGERTAPRLRSAKRALAMAAAEDDHVTVTGKVKFFNEVKGYGFFTRDDGAGDVFVHRTDLPAEVGLLYEGQAVRFEIENTRRGLRAINIALA
jgi:cold shock protein